ncbi:MAG: D-alanine--D-alanine ligase, partial [Verrucomicrobia bacterium]|nr:D-alanine--D-alanine ligase [Verrucomicrobiota bacterium]
MKDKVRVVVLYGGVGAEREVSLRSGAAIAGALGKTYDVLPIVLDAEALPEGIRPESDLIFPALHGTFGEDGRLQALLEAAGVHYCGSDAAASRLCMDKAASKSIARERVIPVPEAIAFDGASAPLADSVIARLGRSLVVKPADQGSSVGLHFTEHRSALGVTLSGIRSGQWLIEQRIRGRELTVGVLEGRAMGVVEIVSQSGVYDY